VNPIQSVNTLELAKVGLHLLSGRGDMLANLDAVLAEYAGNHTDNVALFVNLDIQHPLWHTIVELAVQARDGIPSADIDRIDRVVGEAALRFNVALDLQEVLAGFDLLGRVCNLFSAQNVSRYLGVTLDLVALVQIHHAQ
jgi:hypothetical protein